MKPVILLLFLGLMGACRQEDNSKRSDLPVNETPVYFGDPYILNCSDSVYYLYGTYDPNADEGIKVFKSFDLKNWEGPCGAKNGNALSKDDVFGEWGFWAPEVYAIGDKYYMFYTAEEHLNVAVSSSPTGPFLQEKQVSLFETKAIDGHLFIDSDGKKYLYYVAFSDGNVIWMCEMENDLLSVKPNTVRECFGRSQEWEFSTAQPTANVNEGPFMIKHQEKYYLAYSANHYASPDYGVGVAVAESPEGPWIKYSGNPVLQHPDGLNGSGHCSFFYDKEKQLKMIYHVHYDSTKANPRKVYFTNCSLIEGDIASSFSLKTDAEKIGPLMMDTR